jgi:hypothetical protein
MRNILYSTTGLALALAMLGSAGPALADVDAFASISKNKDITITQDITITKDVTIFVASVFVLPGAAEAQALMNVTNTGNEVDGDDPLDIPNQDTLEDEYDIHLTAIIGGDSLEGSINDNIGVFGVNQDVGNMTNQANVVSVAGIADTIEAFADAQAHAEQENTENTSKELEVLRDTLGGKITDPTTDPEDFLPNKVASITNSINGNEGIIGVNQNAGNMNNQTNGVAAAVGLGAVVALSEADLGQLNSGNKVEEVATVKTATIDGSINGNSGIVNVNQSTGNMNNQGNVVSLAAITSGAFIGTDNPPPVGP